MADGRCDRKAAHKLSCLHAKLRSERLLVGSVDAVGSELYVIRKLNTKAQAQLDELHRLIWRCRHERSLLRRLINSDPEVRPNNCCQLVAELASSDYKEAYRPLGHHAELLAHLLHALSEAPKAVAELTAAAEKLGQKASSEFNSAVFNVIYGSCAFPKEERAMLELLSRLISLQLAGSAEPRKLLRKGNAAFCRLYRLFLDELCEAKVFLTAALHGPVMFLLGQDDFFLDVDPEKLPIRYPAHERAQRFGRDPTSPSYRERLALHRRVVVEKLAAIGQRFIDSLREAMSSCFPQSLRWLVCELNRTLLDGGRVSRSEATLIVTDLVFTNFLCAAIINPEPLGIITDTPVGHIARFNLIQIGQILQTLALLPHERPAAHFDDLLSKLDWSAISRIIDDLLNSPNNVSSLVEVVPRLVYGADGREIYRRKACVATRVEMDAILSVLKSPAVEEISDAVLKRTLKSTSKRLPTRLVPPIVESNLPLGESSSPPPHRSQSSGRLKNLADKVHNAAARGHHRLLHSPSSPFHKPSEDVNREERLAQSSSSSSFQNCSSRTSATVRNGGDGEANAVVRPEVCVFPLSGGTDGEIPIGMEPEEYVMQVALSRAKRTKSSTERKHTRFTCTTASESVVSDRTNEQVSDDDVEGAVQVGVGSETNEANATGVDPTEGSSCSSSNENPVDGGDLGEDAGEGEEEDISTLPDNFSDVAPISANVSARGSNASLSGERADTPLSGAGGAAAANNGDAAPNERPNAVDAVVSGTVKAAPEAARRILPAIPVTIKKQNREGLDEKFGKFALPPQDRTHCRDETYSLVSDSWSTDVGAPSVTSDNEGLNEARNELVLPPSASSVVVPSAVSTGQPPNMPHSSASVGNLAPPVLSAAAHHGGAHGASANVLNAVFSSHTSSLHPLAGTSHASNPPQLSEAMASSAPNSTTAASNHYDQQQQPYYDPSNPTTCKAFSDAKRKLRLVLSSASTPPPVAHTTTAAVTNGTNDAEMDELVRYLKLLLAEAINGRDEAMCAQISEVLRCVTSVFDSRGVRKLMRALRDEHHGRTDYRTYLQESRMTLLKLNSHLDRAKTRINRERTLTSECLVEVLVRFYLEMKEGIVRNFVAEFQSCKAQLASLILFELRGENLTKERSNHCTLDAAAYAAASMYLNRRLRLMSHPGKA